ncbi:MAG: amino acid permease [Halobacteriaceae archaeon]
MSEPGRRSPRRSLGLVDATMVGIGAMIGAGIFVLTGLAAETVGPGALAVFVGNGILTSFTALSYAELAAAIPESGGGYAYVKEAFPEGVSFAMGWMLWFAYMLAGALYAVGFGGNLLEFLHVLGVAVPERVALGAVSVPLGQATLGAVVVVVFVALNAASTSASGGAETFVTLVKVAVLLVFAGFGAFAVDLANFRPLFPHGAVAVLPAMGLTFVAFEGYDLIATVTEEVKNPRENIPRAIFYSLAVTVAVYLLVVFVAVGTVGAAALGRAGEAAIASAAQTFMPRIPLLGPGSSIVAFGAVFSTVSALNAVVLASSRVAFAMGREGQLGGGLGRIHPRFGTPFRAVVASASMMLFAIAFVPVRDVGNLTSLFFLLSFVLVNASAVYLRRRRPDLSRPYEMPLYPLPPILGIAGNVVLGLFVGLDTWALGAAWLLLGGAVYIVLERRD